MSPENMPDNYEAIAHSYSLALLFSRAKVIKFHIMLYYLQPLLSWTFYYCLVPYIFCNFWYELMLQGSTEFYVSEYFLIKMGKSSSSQLPFPRLSIVPLVVIFHILDFNTLTQELACRFYLATSLYFPFRLLLVNIWQRMAIFRERQTEGLVNTTEKYIETSI